MAEAGAKSVVIIGGGAAGMSAASRVRRLRPDWPITVVERGAHVSFILCGVTLDELRRHLPRRSPASLRVSALLTGRSPLAGNPDAVDYPGCSVPAGFVVRYGTDFGENYRYLPDIWIPEDG